MWAAIQFDPRSVADSAGKDRRLHRLGIFICSLKVNQRMIAGITCLLEPPIPFLGRAKSLAGNLPVQKIRFFRFVAIRLDAKIFPFADALHLTQRLIKVVVVQVVQGRDRENQIEIVIWKGKLCRITICRRP